MHLLSTDHDTKPARKTTDTHAQDFVKKRRIANMQPECVCTDQLLTARHSKCLNFWLYG